MMSSGSSANSSANQTMALETLWSTEQLNDKARVVMSGGRKIKSEPIPEFQLANHLKEIEGVFNMTGIEYVGGGACGSVYSGTDKSSNTNCSFKVVSATFNMPFTLLKFCKNTKMEVHIMQRLQHVNIVKFLDCFKINEIDYQIPIRFLIKMEQLDITIGQAASVRLFDETIAMRLFVQIGDALKYMHQSGVSHHDIKTDNIMIERIELLSQLATSTFKLIDFGVAKIYNTPIPSTVDYSRRGTPMYSAPEKGVMGYNPFLTDSFSFAMTLFISMIGQEKFIEIWSPTRSLPDGIAEAYLGSISPKMAKIVSRLIHNDPRQRAFISEALAMAQ